MEKDKVQNDKVLPDGEISNEDLDKVAGGANAVEYGLITAVTPVALRSGGKR